MKKFILLFLIMSLGIFKAQIVNIPDSGFKGKLLSSSSSNTIAKDINGNYFAIDANGDYEIQISEALQVGELKIIPSYSPNYNPWDNVGNFDGISSFTNLKKLLINTYFLDAPITISNLNLLEDVAIRILYPENGLGSYSTTISNCVNLKNLTISRTKINPFVNIPSLENLVIESSHSTANLSHLTAATVTSIENLNNLKTVEIYDVNAPALSLNLSNHNKLTTLKLFNTSMTVNVSDCSILQTIILDSSYSSVNSYTPSVNINSSNCPLLANYHLAQNGTIYANIISKNCPSLINFTSTFAGGCSLSLDNCINLRNIDVRILSGLSVNNCINLESISAISFRLYTLDLSANNLQNLRFLNLNYLGVNTLDNPGYLTSLNVQGITSLEELHCANHQLTNINVLGCTNLSLLECGNNQLTSLNIKNGSNENLIFSGNPNLQYICADDSQLTQVQNLVNSYGYTSCTVNSLCSVPVYIDLCTGTNPDGTLMSEVTPQQDNDWQYSRPDGTILTPETRHLYPGWSYPTLTDGSQKSTWLAGVYDPGNEGYYTYTSKMFTIPADATDARLNLRALSFVRNWVSLVKDNEDGTITETEIARTTYQNDGAKGWWNSRNPLVTDLPIAPGKYFIKVKVYYNNTSIRQSVSVNANINYSSVNPSPVIDGFYSANGSLGTKDTSSSRESLVLYPNPTSNFVTIKSDETITSIQLFDVSGKTLLTNKENKKEITLDISNFPAGIYLAKIESKTGTVTKKIIKK